MRTKMRFSPLAVLFRGRTVSWQFQKAIRTFAMKCYVDGYMMRADPADAIAQYYAEGQARQYVAGECIRLSQEQFPQVPKVTHDELDEITRLRHIMSEAKLGKITVEYAINQMFDIMEGK